MDDEAPTTSRSDVVTNRCVCGWEVRGTVDEVVDATIEHGARIHNMQASRDEVLIAIGAGPQQVRQGSV